LFFQTFRDAELRLARAHKHLTELESLVESLRHTTTKSITFYRDDWTEPLHTFHSEFETLGEVEAGEVQVVIDDVIQNLRTALNYLVTALARFDLSKKNVPRSLQFPIESKKDIFWEKRPRLLHGISAEHVTLIERVQPYNGCHWAHLLGELSNRGKHVELVKLTHDARTLYPTPEDQTNWDRPNTISVTVDCDVVVEVAFEDRSPVVDELGELEMQVANFLAQFKTLGS